MAKRLAKYTFETCASFLYWYWPNIDFSIIFLIDIKANFIMVNGDGQNFYIQLHPLEIVF